LPAGLLSDSAKSVELVEVAVKGIDFRRPLSFHEDDREGIRAQRVYIWGDPAGCYVDKPVRRP